MITNLKIKLNIMVQLKENLRENICNLGIGNVSLIKLKNTSLRRKKMDKLNFTKSVKNTIKKRKNANQRPEKTFTR